MTSAFSSLWTPAILPKNEMRIQKSENSTLQVKNWSMLQSCHIIDRCDMLEAENGFINWNLQIILLTNNAST